jgi:FkbM family methyltransferase
MLKRLKSIARGVTRRLAMAPLRVISVQVRAEALEILSTRMISETPIPGGALKIFAPSPLLQDRAATVLTKEPDMIRWIDGMDKDTVLWDIGANVGVFSLYAAVRTHCAVLSFEPSAANVFVLARNIQLNHLNERVTAYCVALSGATELGILNLASEAIGAALSQFGKAGETSRYWSGNSESAAHGMVGFTIDDFIARFNPHFPTHIKMDVDGLELPILQGATNTLRDPRLRAAMVELSLTNREERDQAMALLEDMGLKFVSQGDEQGTASENAANHLFERPHR